ncbi:hypothetical protein [Gottfriedia solisilvae]|uniref:UDP-glucose 4-epimerase n=1 Tax=Gottfriedia solisilvae TaxID=1516104 RepID=A0A8J3EZ76_9BACI|nr:hypothetical protein [Gottfriedia solisilvae]GGI14992.1 UDP-glucose 4-epimerase [Gottfriedia solisilvae]
MKKCAVIGSSGFIGYELVCQLMEYNDVTAVVTEKGNESDVISEEKIFSIGRNAKVIFVDEEQFTTEDEQYDNIFVCQYFDELRLKGSVDLAQFESIYKMISSKSKELIFLTSTTKKLSSIEKKVSELNKNPETKVTFIELPALYGPWEPPTGLIHELIVSELGKKRTTFHNVYGPNEILYVEDVGKAIRLIAEKELKEQKYTITAKQSVYLPEESDFTGITQLINEIKVSRMKNTIDSTPYVIIQTMSIEDGVKKQKQQIQQYFHLY